MVKKMIRVLMTATALLMVAAFSGCKKEADTSGPAKITIWAWDPNFNIAIMKEAEQRYRKINPEAEIEIVDYAKADLEQKLHTMLASKVTDGLPDIVLIEDYNAQKYLQSYPGSFADLTKEINHKDFLPYKVGLMTVNGKVYGVPFDTGSSGFFYRKDYIEKAGFTEKDMENITWDRFIEIGKAVKAKTGKMMLGFDPTDGGLMRIMMQSAGKWYFDKAGNPDIANNEALAEAIMTYKKIMDAGIIKRTSGWGEWVGSINSGDAASVTSGVWIIGSVKAAADQAGKWKVAPTPRLNLSSSVNASNLGGSSWYVLETSKSKAAAIDFLNKIYAKDVDFYQKILVDKGAVGSYIPSQNGDSYSSADPFFGGQQVFLKFAEWNKEIPAVSFGMYSYEADNIIVSKLSEILKGGDVKKILSDAETEIKSQIQ